LHPDLRADGSAAVSALWHEVQEAYAASDVARMEILLALSDIEANQMANQTVAQLYAVRTELDRALRALEKSLREAEGEDAWDFARVGPTSALRTQVERQLKSDSPCERNVSICLHEQSPNGRLAQARIVKCGWLPQPTERPGANSATSCGLENFGNDRPP
jgi:hypothetical protein